MMLPVTRFKGQPAGMVTTTTPWLSVSTDPSPQWLWLASWSAATYQAMPPLVFYPPAVWIPEHAQLMQWERPAVEVVPLVQPFYHSSPLHHHCHHRFPKLQITDTWFSPEEVGVFPRRQKRLLLTNRIIPRSRGHTSTANLLFFPPQLSGHIRRDNTKTRDAEPEDSSSSSLPLHLLSLSPLPTAPPPSDVMYCELTGLHKQRHKEVWHLILPNQHRRVTWLQPMISCERRPTPPMQQCVSGPVRPSQLCTEKCPVLPLQVIKEVQPFFSSQFSSRFTLLTNYRHRKRGTGGGKLSYQRALLLRTKKPEDRQCVSASVHKEEDNDDEEEEEIREGRRKDKRPVASTPVPGSPWCVVWTGDDRVFFFNPTIHLSVWERPGELIDRDISHIIEDPPHKRKKTLPSEISSSCQSTGLHRNDEDEDDDLKHSNKRNRTEESMSLVPHPGGVQLLPLELRIAHFKEMMLERGVSAFSTWEKELHKMVFDPRYLLLTSDQRKQVFDQFVKSRMKDEYKEKRSKLQKAREEFKQLLEEAKITSSSLAAAFRTPETLSTQPRFLQIEGVLIYSAAKEEMAESNNGSNNTTPQYQGNGAVESAVRNLVSLLLNNISTNPSGRPTESGQPEPRTLTIQQEMTRSFPGHFKSNLSRGKKRCLTSTKQLVKAGSKTTGLSFYLLSKNTSYTPLPAEELELLQAGMGRQTVSLPEDGDHAEISRLLEETFPKMEYLCGGWLLHKATGGSGRRKLTVIPPETEGYSVKTLKAVSGGGKSTFYIVPLQETLDTSPLPPDSQHFSKMPKKLCYQCNEVMPLQMLAVHINTCKGKFSPDETDDEESELCIVKSKCKVICPICTKDFPEDEITVHASLCGDSFQCMVPEENDQTTCTPTQTSVCTTDSVEDVLRCLEQQVDTTTEFKLCVDREDLPDRGILQWQRKKSASPTSVLRVVFIGEAGVDTGALRKEFLSDMISGIESRFFEGPENKGKNPKYSLTDLDNENFRTVGEIIAVSLAQGGPSPAFFKEWCYNFLCSGEVDFSCLSKEDVADVESSLLISKVEDAADIQSLMLWADEIVTCGYTNQIKMDSKESMIRAIVLHSTTRLIPMLQQLRKGMELYGLVNLMAVNPEACHSLFVPGKILKPDADFIMMSCQPHFSEKGTSRERTERKIINFLQDFLQEIEASEKTSETFSNITDGNTGGAGGEKSESLAVQHVLQWMTGQSHVPILPDEKRHFKITCKFDHECKERLGDHSICYPVVSACTCTVTFPVQHLDTYTMFKTIMSAAVRYGGGFHRV